MNNVAIILAAGKGTRYGKSRVNKTAVEIRGKSLVQIGIENIESLVDTIVVVVGHKKVSVIKSIKSNNVVYAYQSKQLGTGHAVKIALEKISKLKLQPSNVLVANGDHLFMIDPRVLSTLIDKHSSQNNDVTVLTANCNSPESHDNGRIKRKNGKIVSIIEKPDFTPGIRRVSELNTGTYIFAYEQIKKILDQTKVNKDTELYITKAIFELDLIGSYTVDYGKVGSGVNTKQELEQIR